MTSDCPVNGPRAGSPRPRAARSACVRKSPSEKAIGVLSPALCRRPRRPGGRRHRARRRWASLNHRRRHHHRRSRGSPRLPVAARMTTGAANMRILPARFDRFGPVGVYAAIHHAATDLIHHSNSAPSSSSPCVHGAPHHQPTSCHIWWQASPFREHASNHHAKDTLALRRVDGSKEEAPSSKGASCLQDIPVLRCQMGGYLPARRATRPPATRQPYQPAPPGHIRRPLSELPSWSR